MDAQRTTSSAIFSLLPGHTKVFWKGCLEAITSMAGNPNCACHPAIGMSALGQKQTFIATVQAIHIYEYMA